MAIGPATGVRRATNAGTGFLPAPITDAVTGFDGGAAAGLVVMSATMRLPGIRVDPTFVGFAPTAIREHAPRRIIRHVPSLDARDLRALLEIVNTIAYDCEADAFSEATLQHLCELLGADWVTYLARDNGAAGYADRRRGGREPTIRRSLCRVGGRLPRPAAREPHVRAIRRPGQRSAVDRRCRNSPRPRTDGLVQRVVPSSARRAASEGAAFGRWRQRSATADAGGRPRGRRTAPIW